MSLAFLVTALVIVATPGTGALYTVAAGLTRGARSSVVAAFGCTLATVMHALAAACGLAALLQASGVAFAIVKYAGVAYLLYLAWMTWHDTGALAVRDDGLDVASTRSVILNGITLNLLNPKLTLFFVAFLPQFVPEGEPGALVTMFGLSGVFVVMTFAVFAVYGVCAAAVRDHVLGRPRVLDVMRKVFAGTFVALGARLAVQSR